MGLDILLSHAYIGHIASLQIPVQVVVEIIQCDIYSNYNANLRHILPMVPVVYSQNRTGCITGCPAKTSSLFLHGFQKQVDEKQFHPRRSSEQSYLNQGPSKSDVTSLPALVGDNCERATSGKSRRGL